MALLRQEKEAVVTKFRRSELDTGSPEVQVALLTERINRLSDHFKDNKKDNHSRQGLFAMVSKRRKLLDYLRRQNPDQYLKLIDALGIRK
jgi:small subunit ribosomal protein S15